MPRIGRLPTLAWSSGRRSNPSWGDTQKPWTPTSRRPSSEHQFDLLKGVWAQCRNNCFQWQRLAGSFKLFFKVKVFNSADILTLLADFKALVWKPKQLATMECSCLCNQFVEPSFLFDLSVQTICYDKFIFMWWLHVMYKIRCGPPLTATTNAHWWLRHSL